MIKQLDKETLKKAINLKVRAWQEELAGVLNHQLDEDKEIMFWTNWMDEEKMYNDQRVLLGYFEGDHLLGAIFTSYAEEEIQDNAVEINGLWVEEFTRGKGIASMLMKEALQRYDLQSYVIVYNHHHAPSNAFYQYLGGKVILKDAQLDGKLDVDVFLFEYKDLLSRLQK